MASKQYQYTLLEIADKFNVFIPGKYKAQFERLIVTSNGLYRIGDVFKGYADTHDLVLAREFNGTIANDYVKHCRAKKVCADSDIIPSILEKHKARYSLQKPEDDVCVLMLRIGDRVVVKQDDGAVRSLIPQVTLSEMKSLGVTKLRIVTAINIGNISSDIHIDREKLLANIELLVWMMDLFTSNGITDIEFISSKRSDNDLIYGIFAKHLIITKGGYGEIAELYGENETCVNVYQHAEWFSMSHPYAKALTSRGGMHASSTKFDKCVVVFGEDRHAGSHYLYKLAKKVDPELTIQQLSMDHVVVKNRLFIFIDAWNLHDVVELSRLYATDFFVHVYGSTALYTALTQYRNFIQATSSSDEFLEMFKGEPYIFIHVPNAVPESIPSKIREQLTLDPGGPWVDWTARQYAQEYGHTQYKKRYSFAFVREPVERLIFTYLQFKENVSEFQDGYAEEMEIFAKVESFSFNEFVEWLANDFYAIRQHCPMLDTQSKHLASLNGGLLVDQVFPTELAETAWSVIKSKAGLVGDLPALEEESDAYHEIKANIDLKTEEEIKAIYSIDFKLHDTAVQVFEKEYAGILMLNTL